MRQMLCTLVLVLLACSGLEASEFAIRTKVYQGTGKQRVAENLTIFTGQHVYDVLAQPARITIWDDEALEFVLLDPEQQTQTRLSGQALLRYVTQLTSRAEAILADDRAVSRRAFLQFLVTPQFHTDFDESAEQLTLSSPVMRYRVSTEKVDPAVARRYRDFADWFARLNALQSPLLPGPRAVLNRTLYSQQRLPRRVELTILQQEEAVSTSFSTHQMIWQLGSQEQDQLQAIREQRKQFRRVPFEQFHRAQVARRVTPRDAKSGHGEH